MCISLAINYKYKTFKNKKVTNDKYILDRCGVCLNNMRAGINKFFPREKQFVYLGRHFYLFNTILV